MKEVLFLLFMPLALGMECISYHDCSIDCIGSSRMCLEGQCVGSSCLEDGPGVDSNTFITWSVRFLILATAAVALALFFPLLRLHNKLWYVLLFVFTIAAGFFLYYIFSSQSTDEQYEIDELDSIVLGLLKDTEYNVRDSVVYPASAVNAKEYRLSKGYSENTLLLAQGFVVDGKEQSQNQSMNIRTEGAFKIYTWSDDGVYFRLVGSPIDTEMIIDKLFNSSQSKQLLYTPGDPPILEVSIPKYIRDNNIEFFATGADRLTLDNQDVMSYCSKTDERYHCRLDLALVQGVNKIRIFAANEHQKVIKNLAFTYDTEPWELSDIEPQGVASIPFASFSMQDVSGINISTLSLTGMNIGDCTGEPLTCSTESPIQGNNTIEISAYDNAGNYNEESFWFIYDTVRPSAEITTKGFIVWDNVGVEDIYVDKRRFDMSTCNMLDDKWHCPSDRVLELRVMDIAGNVYTVENRLKR